MPPTFSNGWVRPQSVVVQSIVSTTPNVSPSPLPACFIGTGRKTKLITSTWSSDNKVHNGVQVTRGATDYDIFDSAHTLTEASMVKTITDQYGSEYTMYSTDNTDGVWELIVQSGSVNTIHWRSATNRPTEGTWYIVNFYIPKIAKTDYQPILMSSLSDQIAWSGAMGYGATSAESHGSNLLNSVSWGATLGYTNGTGQWYCLELDPYDETTLSEVTPTTLDLTTEAGLKTALSQALAKLLAYDAWLIVPMIPMAPSSGINSTLIPVVKAHIAAARSTTYQKFQTALLGAPVNSDDVTDPTALYIAAANSISSRAISYMCPSTAKYTLATVDADTSATTYAQYSVDGSTLAAAAAGVATNPIYDPAEPLAGKELIGFDSIPAVFNTLQTNALGGAGVMIIDSLTTGNPAIVMDLTTDQTSDVASQLKFTKIADYISVYLNKVMRQQYINTRFIGTSTLSSIKNSVIGIFELMKARNIILDYDSVDVTKDGTESRQVDVTGNITLVPDVTWVLNKLGLKL